MGNSSSTDPTGAVNTDDAALLDPFDGADTLGYRVLGVQPNSPASKAGLVSFLDFLVGANGQMLLASGENVAYGEEYPDVDLPALLEENKGQPVEFLVWNMKSQQERLVSLTPDDTWGGAGLLGVTIRLDNYAGAEERLIRVLEVSSPQSPAALAGLVPWNDYILGTTSETLQDTAQFAAILEDHIDCVVELYVYNSESDLVRTVALMPTLSWGGPGLLGAEVGTGYLHRFPSKAQETTGASVERKIRYHGHGQKPPNDAKDGLESKPILELEPQLEMEPPSSEEDEGSQDDNSKNDNDKNNKVSAGKITADNKPIPTAVPQSKDKAPHVSSSSSSLPAPPTTSSRSSAGSTKNPLDAGKQRGLPVSSVAV